MKPNEPRKFYELKKVYTHEEYLRMIEEKELQLRHVPKKFITRKLCLAAVKKTLYALQEVPKEFKTYEICLEAVKFSVVAISFVPEELFTAELFFEAIRHYGDEHIVYESSCIPKDFAKKDPKMSYEKYVASLLKGKSVEELLTHRLIWFREQGKRLSTPLLQGDVP
jgi:hypothetical protein